MFERNNYHFASKKVLFECRGSLEKKKTKHKVLRLAGQLQGFVVAKQNAVRIIVALPMPLYLPKEEQHSGDKDFIFIPLKLEVLFIQYVYRNKPEAHLRILEALKVQQEGFYIYITSPKSVFLLVCL